MTGASVPDRAVAYGQAPTGLVASRCHHLRETHSDAWGIHYERAYGHVGRGGLIQRDRDYEKHMETASGELLEAMQRFYADRWAA